MHHFELSPQLNDIWCFASYTTNNKQPTSNSSDYCLVDDIDIVIASDLSLLALLKSHPIAALWYGSRNYCFPRLNLTETLLRDNYTGCLIFGILAVTKFLSRSTLDVVMQHTKYSYRHKLPSCHTLLGRSVSRSFGTAYFNPNFF